MVPLTEATFEIPADDTDLDTLSDTWEITFHQPESRCCEADFDGDGHSNGTEEFIGTDPNGPGIEIPVGATHGTGNVVLNSLLHPTRTIIHCRCPTTSSNGLM